RLVAAIIEQSHDKHGIIWPESVSPFRIAIVFVSDKDLDFVRDYALKIYNKLIGMSIDVLFYDKKDYLSLILKNIDLIGIPHRIIINDNTIITNKFEYKFRSKDTIKFIDFLELISVLIY
ncbi:MAG: His/Gly/Thr/Pro-type tRNA ligase C-terminal domain-containing protein, partial [Enterobacteriaceae bacterium]|nr:His/Gly/Thr/Pro-type tRNA ligase C-terminal domain-containing protein [Enterobacteriaceae bacterium]